MPIDVNVLFRSAFYAFFLGVFWGVSYDVFRIFRVFCGISFEGKSRLFGKVYGNKIRNYLNFKRIKCFEIPIVFITDLLFMIIVTISFAVFLFAFNYGVFRWFILVSAIVGFLLYYFTFGKVVIRLSGEISAFITLVINLLFGVFLIPARFIGLQVSKIFAKTLERLYTRVKNTIDIRKKKLYTVRCIKKVNEFVEFKVK